MTTHRAIGRINGTLSEIADLKADTVNDITITRGTSTTNTQSTFVGGGASPNINTSAYNLVAYGYGAFQLSTTLNESVGIGVFAGVSLDSGYHNVIIGQEAVGFGTSAFRTIAIGAYALNSLDGGNENVAIGYQSGVSAFASNRSLYLGNYAGFSSDSDDKLWIANAAFGTGSNLITGDFALGKVGINIDPNNIDAGAAFQIFSTTGGFLGPKLTTTERNAVTASAGLEIFNTTKAIKEYHNGTEWVELNGIYKLQYTVDFGTSGNEDMASGTVSCAWVKSTSSITATVVPMTTDHDPEDVVIEQLHFTVGNIINNTSFDIFVHAPEETWGRYIVNITGVI